MNLPEGFTLDQNLPKGFVLDRPTNKLGVPVGEGERIMLPEPESLEFNGLHFTYC